MYKAAGFSEFLEKLRKKERELYRCLVFPAEEPILEFSLRSYLPTEERVGQEMCMREMPQWVDFWKNPPEKQGRPLWHVETQNRKLALWGKQSGIPVRAVVKSAEDAFCLLHLEKEMREFLEIYRETERELPEATEWLLENYQKLPQVKSMLMDEPRLLKDLEAGLVEDTGTVPSALPYLTVREKQVWKLLHDQGKRLEQEKFPVEKIEGWLRREGFLRKR